MMEDRSTYVRVVNHNKDVAGRFNGKDYVFKTGKPLNVPELVARHIFGFGLEDKTSALSRLGWARTSDELEAGLEKLAKVTFDDVPEQVDAPKRTGTAGPPVNAGGTEGGGFSSPPKGPKIGEVGAR